MKKLVFTWICLALFAGSVAAQRVGYAPSGAELKYRMSLDAPQLYKRYKSGSMLSGVGMGLTLGGVAAIVVGIATADKETVKDGLNTQVNLSGPGAGVFAAGMVSALAGTPLWIIGGSKKRKARNAYFREFGYSAFSPVQPSSFLQFNAARNQLALAFVF